MGSRGQSRKRQLAQLDRASERYNSLQERSDSISPIGGRFYDNNTGREIPREEVEKLSEDLNASRERFEDLRDKMIERENTAAQRARERAAKRQETKQRQEASKALKKGLAVAEEYAKNSLWGNGRYEIYQNEWKKYGKHRIYISFSGFTRDGREEKNYAVGYVDVLNGKFYKTI